MKSLKPGKSRSCSKRNKVGVLALAASILAGSLSAQAPAVDWRRSDWFPTVSPTSSSSQYQENSGEDWWYHHANSYNSSNELQGYVAAGFSGFRNYSPIEWPTGCY